jgi:hypothetical protein
MMKKILNIKQNKTNPQLQINESVPKMKLVQGQMSKVEYARQAD